MAAVGTGVGGNVDAQLVGAFLKRVGEQCRGAGASAQNQNLSSLALRADGAAEASVAEAVSTTGASTAGRQRS